jgi:hypothetical protein
VELLTAAGLKVSTAVEASEAVVSVQDPVHSTETTEQLEDTRHLADRGVPAQGPLAASGMVDKQEAFPHAEVPASGAGDFTVAVAEERVGAAGVVNRTFVIFAVDCEPQKWREAICGERR